MKYIKKLLLILICLSCLSGCKEKPLRLLITSDNHYYSDSLHDDGVAFNTVINESLMIINRSKAINEEFVEVAIKEKPDYLIVAGDITFNGELESLKEVSALFKKIEDAGIPVLVIPGNHDISYPLCFGYDDKTQYTVENYDKDTYLELIGDFGYNESLYKDTASFSYITKLSKDNYVLMLDVNVLETRGSCSLDTIEWLKETLPKIDEKASVFAVLHQPIIQPFDKAYMGYEVYNSRVVKELFDEYGIKDVYVGHIHSEREKDENNLHQQTIPSLLVEDLRYGEIIIENKVHTYSSYTFSSYIEEGMQKAEAIRAARNANK